MAKKPTKSKAGTKLVADQMLKAKNLFMEKQGEISDVQMARIVGAHRVTIAKWRKNGNWESLLAQIRQAADKKAVEKASDKIAEISNWVTDELMATTRVVSFSLRRMMIVHDEKGRPVLDGNGQPTLNPKLSPSDIRSIASTIESVQRAVRLETGKSTQNTDQRITAAVASSVQTDPLFEKAIQKIMETGDADAQDALAKMVESRQKVLALAGGQDE